MASNPFDDLLEARLPSFYESDDDDSRLSELPIKAVFQVKVIVDTLTSKDTNNTSSERALAVIVSTIEDNSFRPIQDCETAIEAWKNFNLGIQENK